MFSVFRLLIMIRMWICLCLTLFSGAEYYIIKKYVAVNLDNLKFFLKFRIIFKNYL